MNYNEEIKVVIPGDGAVTETFSAGPIGDASLGNVVFLDTAGDYALPTSPISGWWVELVNTSGGVVTISSTALVNRGASYTLSPSAKVVFDGTTYWTI